MTGVLASGHSSPPGLPQRKEVTQILELLFTPEEAEVALMIPMRATGALSLAQLSQRSGRSETELRTMINNLLIKGPLYMRRSAGGEETYCLNNFSQMIYDNVFSDGIDDDQKRQIRDLREKLEQSGGKYSAYHYFDSRYPLMRVMPYEPAIDPSAQVEPWERISHYVNQAELIAVNACQCRMSTQRCTKPIYTCMHFSSREREATEYWVKYRRGRYISREECLQIIENSVKAGLVTTGPNRQEMPPGICNCCHDCCALLRGYIEYHLPYTLAKSNFVPQFNLDKCRICNLCKEACPVEAIGHRLRHHSDEQDRPVVVEERCIGCGVCAAACPREAITLRKVRNVTPEPTAIESLARHMAEKVW